MTSGKQNKSPCKMSFNCHRNYHILRPSPKYAQILAFGTQRRQKQATAREKSRISEHTFGLFLIFQRPVSFLGDITYRSEDRIFLRLGQDERGKNAGSFVGNGKHPLQEVEKVKKNDSIEVVIIYADRNDDPSHLAHANITVPRVGATEPLALETSEKVVMHAYEVLDMTHGYDLLIGLDTVFIFGFGTIGLPGLGKDAKHFAPHPLEDNYEALVPIQIQEAEKTQLSLL
ncbi:hypothetical protein K457DRAFT_123295 [Linnemannia elongata AG-77]|uniref:Uncharacterized protein n=1 Tax=Linnemannia elongata AG-77 TaxID=1314771 RepID=A0A197K7K1_9FUNG|nr:hypothetical protein K457DRAFT_123295 [Linnemannia elongata AG-77]